jgi:tetratricopeptide (TPR) repeat protein
MNRKLQAWSIAAGLTLILPLLGSFPEARGQSLVASSVAVEHNRKGLGYFNTGFYELAPKRQAKEADRFYEMAAAEFKKAISLDAKSIEAHRNLARVWYVQEKYAESAEMYKIVTLLDPRNPDDYLPLADAYARIGNVREAIVQLEIAKTYTTDAAALEKLNGFIEKLKSGR